MATVASMCESRDNTSSRFTTCTTLSGVNDRGPCPQTQAEGRLALPDWSAEEPLRSWTAIVAHVQSGQQPH